MTREEMMNNVAKRCGLEDSVTVWFCLCAESFTDDDLVAAYYAIAMDAPICED